MRNDQWENPGATRQAEWVIVLPGSCRWRQTP